MNQPSLIDVPGTGELSGAHISSCGTDLFTLERVWDTTLPLAIWVMLNPSSATADVDDPTIRRVRSFSKRERCGGFTVVNLFGLRSPDPAALAGHPDPVGPGNDAWITAALANEPAVVIAAWGAHPLATARAARVLELIAAHNLTVKCLGTTKTGQPRHPLYRPNSQPLINLTARRAAV